MRDKPVLLLCWRGTDGDVEPVPSWCETFGHPNSTTNGERMFANTHFRTPEEAWVQIEKSIESQLVLALSELERARDALVAAERRMMEAGERAARVVKRRSG